MKQWATIQQLPVKMLLPVVFPVIIWPERNTNAPAECNPETTNMSLTFPGMSMLKKNGKMKSEALLKMTHNCTY